MSLVINLVSKAIEASLVQYKSTCTLRPSYHNGQPKYDSRILSELNRTYTMYTIKEKYVVNVPKP